MKKYLNKIWTFFEGNKRRIAMLGAFVAQITPEYTVAYQIGQGIFLLFASADLLQYSNTKFIQLTKGK